MEIREKIELRKLQSKRERLLNEKKRLMEEIEEMDEKEEFACAESRGNFFRDGFYRKLPLGWLDSVYVTQIENILPFISSTLSIYDVDMAVSYLRSTLFGKKITHQYYALLCECYILTEHGAVLTLRDPYRIVHTQPLEMIDENMAQKLLGHILIVKAAIREDQQTSNELDICSIKKLMLTRNGIVEDGTEKIIPSFLAQEFAFRNKVIRPEDCAIERERMERQARKNGWCVYRIGAKSAYSYFVKRNYMCALTQSNNILELVIKPNMSFSDLDWQFMRNLEKYSEGPEPLASMWERIRYLQEVRQQCANPTLQDV